MSEISNDQKQNDTVPADHPNADMVRQLTQMVLEASEKSTRGPWKVYEKDGERLIGTVDDHPQLRRPAPVITSSHHVRHGFQVYMSPGNADYIVAACNLSPAMAGVLTEALSLIEKISKLPYTQEYERSSQERQTGLLVCSDMAKDFLEKCQQNVVCSFCESPDVVIASAEGWYCNRCLKDYNVDQPTNVNGEVN